MNRTDSINSRVYLVCPDCMKSQRGKTRFVLQNPSADIEFKNRRCIKCGELTDSPNLCLTQADADHAEKLDA